MEPGSGGGTLMLVLDGVALAGDGDGGFLSLLMLTGVGRWTVDIEGCS